MVEGAVNAVHEFEVIEGDDALHDFGALHGNKGHDFAAFWVIARVTELEAAKAPDYLFVIEYMQDVAEFDSSSSPQSIQLYQLKKKEDGYWTAAVLTGQTGKSKKPKVDKPVWKLLRHVRTVKGAKATGAFITNGRFDVSLASGQKSVNEERIPLHHLDDAQTLALKKAVAAVEGVKAEDIDLAAVELRSEAIAINDLQRHANGIMLEFLQHVVPAHAGQAASLVDALYVRLRKTARRTEKAPSWPELVKRRGFNRAAFQSAVAELQTIPDKAAARLQLFDALSADWRNVRRAKVAARLTQCATEKILFGESSRWHCTDALSALFALADQAEWTDQARFDAACLQLLELKPEMGSDEISALAISEMTEWDLNQTHA